MKEECEVRESTITLMSKTNAELKVSVTSVQTRVEDLDFENDEMLRDIACFKALTPREHHEQLCALDPGCLQQAPAPAFLPAPTLLGSPNHEASMQILASLQHLSLSLGYPASTASLPASMTSTQSSLAPGSSSAGAEAEQLSLLHIDGSQPPATSWVLIPAAVSNASPGDLLPGLDQSQAALFGLDQSQATAAGQQLLASLSCGEPGSSGLAAQGQRLSVASSWSTSTRDMAVDELPGLAPAAGEGPCQRATASPFQPLQWLHAAASDMSQSEESMPDALRPILPHTVWGAPALYAAGAAQGWGSVDCSDCENPGWYRPPTSLACSI